MPYKHLFFLLLSAFTVQLMFAQPLEKGKLDQYFQQLGDNNKLMSSVAVFRGYKNIYSNYGGFANIDAKIKSDSNTMYRIGSISKTITATLILKAVEEGKLSLSQNIKTFFPDIENAEQITIRNLLNHHSGVHNFTGGNFMSWNTQPKNRHDLLDTIAKGGSDFAPGTKAAYSNSNYVLLSFVLEDIYRESYGAIVNKTIIQPLQLHHFKFGDKEVSSNNKAISYYFEAGWKAGTKTDLSIPLGAGAFVSSANDLASVITAIFQGKIISIKMLDTMKIQADGFGAGVFEKDILGKTAYTHDGAIDGFNSFYYYFPGDETVYILLSNAENTNLDRVNNLVLSSIYNQPFTVPTVSNIKVTAKELDLYTGTYSSKSSPLIIEISTRNDFLLAQPHGQGIYTMEPTAKDVFIHEKTGVTLTFDPVKNQFSLKQGSQNIIFNKQ